MSPENVGNMQPAFGQMQAAEANLKSPVFELRAKLEAFLLHITHGKATLFAKLTKFGTCGSCQVAGALRNKKLFHVGTPSLGD